MFVFELNSFIKIVQSGSTDIFNQIRSSNREVIKKIGEPVNGFSKFTLMGQTTHAVICDRCDVIDANLNDREPVNLETYRADLHVCVSRERKRLQVRVQQAKK